MKNLFSLCAALFALTSLTWAQCDADHTVEASSFQYAPANLTIEAGESVAFINTGGFHDVNGVTNTITGESFGNPEDFSLAAQMGEAGGVCLGVVTFDTPGTYGYDCSIGNHAEQGMVATITVNAPPSNTVVDVIVNSPDHELLEAAVGAAGLVDALSADGPFTVFAPTDAAIGALAEALMVTAEELLALEDLPAILQYHVVAGTALSTDLSDGQMITTLLGEDITVTINTDGVFINDAMVTVADIAADNGVVHVIDAVLLPPTPETTTVVDIIVDSPDHELLEAAVGAAGLVDALSADGPFTVFAPTDAAIGALAEALMVTAEELLALEDLPAILQYHVVAGTALSTDLSDGQMITTLLGEDITVTINTDGVFINDAMVTVADILADNGVVHVIDAVLLPPTPEATTVVDIIVDSPDHELLEAAVGAAGLVEALSAEGPFTVFAPTDAAITSLAEDFGVTPEILLTLPQLGALLQYHVVAGLAMSTDLSDGQTITTLLGEDVTVTINADGVFINDAMVTVADLVADNGVVHVIDMVLLPPVPETTTVWDIVVNSDDHTYLEAAVDAAGLSGALSGTDTLTVFAPTDAAFETLAEALEVQVADLLALPNLSDILLYHVVGGLALSTDLSDGMTVPTLNGADLTVTINADGVFINDAMVVVADILADNGVVHVIDAVLVPATDGIAEATADWTMAPNPASDVVTLTGIPAQAKITVFDLSGRAVLNVTPGQRNLTVADMAPGTYIVSVAQGSSVRTQKLVVR